MRLTLSAMLVAMTVTMMTTMMTAILPSPSWARAAEDDSRAERTSKQMEMQAAFARIGGMKTVVNHLAQMSLACETVSDCTAIAMGQRACGGPTSFVVTSQANPSMDALVESIQLVTKAEAEANRKFGLMSICSIEMPPALACVKPEGETQTICQASIR